MKLENFEMLLSRKGKQEKNYLLLWKPWKTIDWDKKEKKNEKTLVKDHDYEQRVVVGKPGQFVLNFLECLKDQRINRVTKKENKTG